jgi:hypothetical protein
MVDPQRSAERKVWDKRKGHIESALIITPTT